MLIDDFYEECDDDALLVGSLYDNQLSGTIASQFGRLTGLVSLYDFMLSMIFNEECDDSALLAGT